MAGIADIEERISRYYTAFILKWLTPHSIPSA
jgi:hypothetical protein